MTEHSTAITAFDVAAILIVLAALFGYINHRFLKLPSSVGMTLMGALASLTIIGLDRLMPNTSFSQPLVNFLHHFDFYNTLMQGMLCFMLFGGALHVDWSALRKGRAAVVALSTAGVLISTVLVGTGTWLVAQLLSIDLPLIWAMVFGALISPTDPVAVTSMLQRANFPPTLQATIAGESLFNDGVGVVVFTILLGVAVSGADISLGHAAHIFLIEAGGGLLLGLIIGWIGFVLMRSIDDYEVEVMLSLGMVMGGYALAMALHISGPVAMAVAGLLIGNAGVSHAMSDITQDYLVKFWELIDAILNAVLFLLIGLEVIVLFNEQAALLLGVIAIPIVLIARAISVWIPLQTIKRRISFGPMAMPTLVWGGLRGGISVALALSLPEGPVRTVIVTATYIIVLFSVLVQGGTMQRLLHYMTAKGEAETPPA